MWIKKITLDDFGCFHDARFGALEQGLNVVAGPQRAGKTTLMEAVRRLGYGIGRGSDLPPAADRYSVVATVVRDGFEYEIELDHYADPRVTSIDAGAPDLGARDLFGGVREEQYRQLYTISLDELRRNPSTVDDGVDISRILLGAGFGEASDIPDLVDDLSDSAYEIGRTTGSQGGPIREAIRTIEAGDEAKEDAVDQVEQYERTREELTEVRARIEGIDSAIDEYDDEETRLEVVKAGYEDYERLVELRRDLEADDVEALESFPLGDLDRVRTLDDQYEECRDVHRTALSDFESTVSVEEPEAHCQRLLSERAAIERYKNELTGYKSRVDGLEEDIDELEGTRTDLDDRIADLHPEWETVEDVEEFETDLFSESAVRGRIEEYEDAEERCAELGERIEELSGEVRHFDDRIESAETSSEATAIRDYVPHIVVGVGGSLAVGALASAANPILGVLVTALLLVLVGGYLIQALRPGEASHEGVSVEHLRAQKQEKEGALETREERLRAAEERRDEAGEKLEGIVEEYELPDETSPAALQTFYDELLEISDEIVELERREEKLEETRSALREELRAVADDLEAVGVLDEFITDPLEEHATLFAAIERASSQLERATAVQTAQNEVRSLEADLHPHLKQWDGCNPSEPGEDDFRDVVSKFLERGATLEDIDDRHSERETIEAGLTTQLENGRVSAAFDPIREQVDGANPEPIDSFETVYDEYESVEAIEERLETVRQKVEELEAEKEVKQTQVAELQTELTDLKSDEDVREAHETIQVGRAALESHLEEYAQYRIAEYLLEQLHEKYLDRTTGPLLEEASEIFGRITNGTYEEVRSRDEFDDLDFETSLADGGCQQSGELSRATAEQLFLAVRLAKIKLEEEPLPVLIDDSLTNFDPAHVHRTVEVVSELAHEQQVLVLTCHPAMLDCVDAFHEATYWTVENGSFGGPSADPGDATELLEDRVSLTYSD